MLLKRRRRENQIGSLFIYLYFNSHYLLFLVIIKCLLGNILGYWAIYIQTFFFGKKKRA
jgi:hypothetical protein